MIRLSFGDYALIDDVIYEQTGYSAVNDRMWLLKAVLPDAIPARREIAAGSPGLRVISPWATYRGVKVSDLIYYEDDTVGIRVWTDRPGGFESWPQGILVRYTGGQRTGDNYWEGRIALSELEDLHDDVPDEWRPFLRDDAATFREFHDWTL
ncbi:hypothetical protein ACFWHT_04380 [Microbacterium sp. NPDC058342]|uniref:hypothetical protein n=1 Tax=Microbacterium sp. NPDC058342 TaxID=3346454 RepID=UPI00365FBFAA